MNANESQPVAPGKPKSDLSSTTPSVSAAITKGEGVELGKEAPATYKAVNLSTTEHPNMSSTTTLETWMPEARQFAAQCWCDDATKDRVMDPVLAEAVARRIAAWMDSAAQFARNEEFYRNIVHEIGDLFGVAARTSDDGSIQQDVLALRVPELVRGIMVDSRQAPSVPSGNENQGQAQGNKNPSSSSSSSATLSVTEGEKQGFREKEAARTATRAGQMGRPLFSTRCEMADKAVQWCATKHVEPTAFNIVTALCVLGYFDQEKCEGCGDPATTHDSEGVPLCATCAALP